MTKNLILIIEDEKSIRDALQISFSQAGINLLEAADGKSGLEIALKKRPQLIILDVIMPKMHGIDMLNRLQEDKWGKTVPVILLTNYADDPKVTQAVTENRCELLEKSKCTLDDIVNIVKKKIGIQ